MNKLHAFSWHNEEFDEGLYQNFSLFLSFVFLSPESGASLDLQNRRGETALLIAAEHGHTDIVRALLGLDANDRPLGQGAEDVASTGGVASSTSPVSPAATTAPAPAAAAALASVTSPSSDSATANAAAVPIPTPVPARPTASPHLVNAHGLTPLHTAMQWGRVASARALVAAGADTRAVTRGGKTPLDLAKYGWSDGQSLRKYFSG
jgi:ankyrin repeat protein